MYLIIYVYLQPEKTKPIGIVFGICVFTFCFALLYRYERDNNKKNY